MSWTRANQLAVDNQAPPDEAPCLVCGDDGDFGIAFEDRYICVDCVLSAKADDCYVDEADKQKVRDDITMNGGEG